MMRTARKQRDEGDAAAAQQACFFPPSSSFYLLPSLFPIMTLFLDRNFPQSHLDGNVRLTVVFYALDVKEEMPSSPSAQLHPQHGLGTVGLCGGPSWHQGGWSWEPSQKLAERHFQRETCCFRQTLHRSHLTQNHNARDPCSVSGSGRTHQASSPQGCLESALHLAAVILSVLGWAPY